MGSGRGVTGTVGETHRGRWLSVVALVAMFAADRIHKFVQIDVLGWTEGTRVTITPFFDYVLVFNPGVSYGLLAGLHPLLLALVMGIAMLVLAVWWWRSSSPLVHWGIAIALGGALGNLADRFIYGGVADFFSLHAGEFYWYVFNIADIGITLGVVLMIADMVLPGRNPDRKKAGIRE